MSFKNSRFAGGVVPRIPVAQGREGIREAHANFCAQQTLVVTYCLARGVEFLCSYLGAACASAKQFEGDFRPDVKAVVVSVDFLEPSTDREGFGRRRACATAPFADSNRLALRGERWIVAKARATKSASVNPWSGSTKRFITGTLVVCARRGTEHARSASTENKMGKSNCIFALTLPHIAVESRASLPAWSSPRDGEVPGSAHREVPISRDTSQSGRSV